MAGEKAPHDPEQVLVDNLGQRVTRLASFFGMDAAGLLALRSHLLPQQTPSPLGERMPGIRRLRAAWEEYIAAGAGAEDSGRFAAQTQLMQRLLGRPADVIAPRSVSEDLIAHPSEAPALLPVLDETLKTLLDYLAERHPEVMARAMGRLAARRTVDLPDPGSEEAMLQWGDIATGLQGSLEEGPLFMRADSKTGEIWLPDFAARRLSDEELEELAAAIRDGTQALRTLNSEWLDEDERAAALQRAADGERARRMLAVQNLPLVLDIVHTHHNLSVGMMDDAIQQTVLGLLRAVEKYDPHYFWTDEHAGQPIVQFGAVAYRDSWGYLMHHYSSELRARTVGSGVLQDDIALFRRVLEEARRSDPTVEPQQVAAWLGYNTKQLEFILKGRATSRWLSLDYMDIDVEGQSDLYDEWLEDVAVTQEFADAAMRANFEALWPTLCALLTERERQAIELYYFAELNTSEVGRALGLSDNRGNQLVKSAHEKLRAYAAAGTQQEREDYILASTEDNELHLLRELGYELAITDDRSALRQELLRAVWSSGMPEVTQDAFILYYGLHDTYKPLPVEFVSFILDISQKQVMQRIRRVRNYLLKRAGKQ